MDGAQESGCIFLWSLEEVWIQLLVHLAELRDDFYRRRFRHLNSFSMKWRSPPPAPCSVSLVLESSKSKHTTNSPSVFELACR